RTERREDEDRGETRRGDAPGGGTRDARTREERPGEGGGEGRQRGTAREIVDERLRPDRDERRRGRPRLGRGGRATAEGLREEERDRGEAGDPGGDPELDERAEKVGVRAAETAVEAKGGRGGGKIQVGGRGGELTRAGSGPRRGGQRVGRRA